MFKRIKKWLEESQKQYEERQAALTKHYVYVITLTDGEVVNFRHSFKPIYLDEWGADYYPSEQAKDYVGKLISYGFTINDVCYSPHSIKTITYDKVKDEQESN